MSNQLLETVSAPEEPRKAHSALARNILFATDFSEASLVAFRNVAALADFYGSKVHVVHGVGSGVFSLLPQLEQDRLVQEAEGKMQEFLKSAPEIASSCHRIVSGGEPSEIVRNLCKQLGIDLLVLGTHGRRGLKRFVLGSVAEEIFRLVPCPVLTIGPKSQRGTTTGVQLRKILFATDLEPASLEALPYAVKLAKDCQASLVLLHVASTQDKVREARIRLAEVASEQDPAVKLEMQLAVGAPAPTVLKTAAKSLADLVILGVRGGGDWARAATHAPGPVAYNVIAQAPCPVLTLRAQAAARAASKRAQ